MKESPRTFWQYLKGSWHTFELRLSPTEVQLQEHFKPGETPNVWTATLTEFLNGALHDQINASMNASVLPEALESARKLKK